MHDRIGRNDDRSRSYGDAEIACDLRQQRIGRPHHRLAGKPGNGQQALVCEGTGMDEEGASTLYLSDFGGELAGDYIVEAMRRRPLLALMTHVMAAWRGRAHQVIRRASS